MSPSKWDEESSSDDAPNSPPVAVHRRGKFDDEEDDSDVLESWDAAEDSEVEREKAKKAAEAKTKADAAAKANHKTKSQRVEEHRMAAMRRRQAEEDAESSEEEDEAERRARMRKNEQDADLKHAEDLFGELSTGPTSRSSNRPVMVAQGDDPNNSVDLSKLAVFNPATKPGFDKLRDTVSPLIAANAKKAQYTLFLQDFVKNLAKDLPSDQIKKLGSALTTLSNEKMREEKAAEKGGKKTKAAKTKTSLNAARDVSTRADTSYYGEELGDDDFM